MAQPTFATAADYADALLTARRFKTTLVLVILFTLLLQIALFFLARFDILPVPRDGQTAKPLMTMLLQYLTVAGTFAGLISTLVLSMVLLLIAMIMLVGRLIGVGRVVKAYVWTVILLALLFPWQAVYVNPTLLAARQGAEGDFRVPGVLYTWTEMSHPTLGANFVGNDMKVAVLRWARFVGFPLVAAIILLTAQASSARGLRQALGEVGEIPREDETPVV